MVILQLQLVGFALLELCHLLEVLCLGCLEFVLQNIDFLLELLDDLLLLKQLDVAVNLPRLVRAYILAILHLVFEIHTHFVHANFDSLLQYLNFSPLLLIGNSLLSQAFFGILAAFFIVLNEQFDLILGKESLTKLGIPFFNPL